MATRASIHNVTNQADAGVDEKTPLLVSIAVDITPTTSAATTPTLEITTPNATIVTPITQKQATPTASTIPKTKSPRNQNSYLKQKAVEIELLLSQPEIDLWKLREFALTPGGLVNDAIRKRAWPKLVGLDHNYDPLLLDDVVVDTTNAPSSSTAADANIDNDVSTSLTKSQSVVVPTIEIDAQHELLKDKEGKTTINHEGDLPPSSTLIVESMDTAQIDRDVARCTWHLLTGTQRSRRSQHRQITQNSTRGTGYGSTKTRKNNNNKQLHRSQNHQHSAKYRRNRKVAVLMKKKQNRLANLINLTLAQSYDRSDGRNTSIPSPNRLRYYQGYHDVACIFLHALGGAGSNSTPLANNNANSFPSPNDRIYGHYSSGDLELPSKVLCQVSFSHFSDALRSDFLRLQTGLKLVLFPLLSKIDRELHDHLLDADMEPFFCLSWILTWFAHDVRDTSLVKRLFDAFLVGHPALPIYATLAMMTHPYNRQMIMETDCDFAALHQCLASLPKHSCKVGYKERRSGEYVSDDEGDGTAGDNATIITNTDSYLEEEQSEFDDNDSHTFDTTSNYTNDTIFTESSFPMSVNSTGQLSNTGLPSTIRKSTSNSNIAGSLASGSLASFQEYEGCPTDRTMISTEEPDFLSKESTLVSGKWDGSWGSDIKGNIGGDGMPNDTVGATMSSEKTGMFEIDDHNPVPFESVLDNALQLIKTYPPRSLVALAKAYFQDDWDSQLSLLSTASANKEQSIDVQELIGLLQPTPPPWSVLPSCTSDWIDKQKQRQDLGLKPTSRKDRRRRKQKKNLVMKKNNSNRVEMSIDCSATPADTIEEATTIDKNKAIDPMEYVRSNPEDRVVAAIGYGPGMEAKIRQRKLLRQQRRIRKRRRALMIGCGAVVVGAIAMYGGLKLVGNGGTPEDFENPAPPHRQLRSEEGATMRKAADFIAPRLKTIAQQPEKKELPLSTTKDGFPVSPERSKINASSPLTRQNSVIPKISMISTSPTPAPSANLPAPIPLSVASVSSSGRRAPPLTLAIEKSSILNGMLRKTKLMLTRFAHHLWIVCRGFLFPFRFLQHSQSKLEY